MALGARRRRADDHSRAARTRWRRRRPKSAPRPAPRSRPSPPTSRRPRAAPRRSPPARSPTSWSTTPAARRRAISATGTRRTWQAAVNANMLTPIMLIRAVVDGMIARKFGRIVNITSASVKAPIPVLGLSNGARAGLTGFVAGLARQVVQAQRDDQQPAARAVRHRPAALDSRVRRRKADGKPVEADRRANAAAEPGRPFRHRRGVRRRPAPSCAAPRPVTSPARMWCSMAAPTRARCNICYGPGCRIARRKIFFDARHISFTGPVVRRRGLWLKSPLLTGGLS